MIRKVPRLLYLAMALTALTAGCKGNANSNDKGGRGRPGEQKGPAKLPVVALQPYNVELKTEFPANLQGKQNVDIRPKVDGYISNIYIDEGSPVKAGQLLFTINNPQYEQEAITAEAAIQSATAAVTDARLRVQKTKPLVDQDIISKYELEAAQLNLRSQQALLAQAQARLRNARTNVGYTRIVSPVNGIVGTLPYKTGALVSSTSAQPLTTISNISTIYAYFSINEKQLLTLGGGSGGQLQQKIKALPAVSLVLANGTVYDHKGHIETIAGQLNAQTGAATVRAAFPNPQGLLRTGLSAIVQIPTYVNQTLVVPQRSTTDVQGKKFVYVVGAGNRVNMREIDVRDNTTNNFFIVNKGVSKGEQIVTDGFTSLKEGDTIVPQHTSADEVFSGLNK